MRHINIPIFIPHLGCPNDCVFCNQRSISGHGDFKLCDVRSEIETALLTTTSEDICEIAFFGGSFTGIDRELMVSLLRIAQEYIDDGRVESIRLSTRPDYISSEILDILKEYSVRTVELGLQSMDDGVLAASRRGHDRECARRACRLVKQYGFELIGQMMIGLPASDVQKEIDTARELCELCVDGARVYPTVVFYDTELCLMAERGEYMPLDTDDAVFRCAQVLDIFDRAGVPCIRVGLCASENLSDPEKVYGGASHSAIGELAMGELYYLRICDRLREYAKDELCGRAIRIFVRPGCISKAIGQKRRNADRLCREYSLCGVRVAENDRITGYGVEIEIWGSDAQKT